jgi:predicted DNA-binding transcriptional regulator AlpA
MDTDRKAYSVREFCARNGICRQTFYDEIRRGHLHARKLGKKTIVTAESERAWLESLPPLRLAATA